MDDLSRALAAVETRGLLLLQDPALPSLAALVAGEVVRGSWWGHAAASRIFHASGALDGHADVAVTKLVAGKVTFVHRRLWPAVAAIGRARESWQLDRLDRELRDLLDRVDREGRVRAKGKPAKTLEVRLLVAGQQVHTETGAHATELSSWARFAEERGVGALPDVATAKDTIERAARELGADRLPLPWLRAGA